MSLQGDEDMSTEKAVRVTIEGTAHDDGGIENVQLATQGRLNSDAEGFVLSYEETAPDSAVSGTTTLDCHMQRVSMKREGEVLTTLVFQKNGHFLSTYTTPYGDLALQLYTQDVQYEQNEAGGRIWLNYRLDVNGHITTHKLAIQFAPQAQ